MFNFLWWIPTKKDKFKWLQDELKYLPSEKDSLVKDFIREYQDYTQMIGEFENMMSKQPPDFLELYLKIKTAAQKVHFLSERLKYKNEREIKIRNELLNLKDEK